MSNINDVGSFLIDQLAWMQPEVYEIKYPEVNYKNLLFVDSSAPALVDFVYKRIIDSRGKPKWVSPDVNDIPRVSEDGKIVQHTIHSMALGLNYGMDELTRAIQLGRNLTADRLNTVRRELERALNDVAKFGDLEKQMPGFYNFSVVPTKNAAKSIREVVEAIDNMGGGSQEAINFFRENVSKVWIEQTNSIYRPTHIAVPLRDYDLMSGTMLPFAGNVSFLRWMESNLSVTFIADLQLQKEVLNKDGLPNLTSDRMVVFTRDPDVAKLHLPMPIQNWGDMYSKDGNKTIEMDYRMRTGGTEISIPDAMLYVDLPDYPAPFAEPQTTSSKRK